MSQRSQQDSRASGSLLRPASSQLRCRPKTSRYPVLYYFHGLGGDEQTLVSGGGWDLIQDLWDRHQIGEFIIAAPAAGRSFYINSRDGNVRYEDFLIREFFPFIESHYRIEPGRRNRGVTGMSMGGYGALHIAFAHPELFGAVSAHSPALIAKLPRAEFDSEDSFGVMRLLGSAFGNPFDHGVLGAQLAIYDSARQSSACGPRHLYRLRHRG